jgi:hypothetical protein
MPNGNHITGFDHQNSLGETALWVSNGFARMHHGYLNV